MTKKRPRWEDKTPSQPVRLKSGAALNLLDLAAAVTREARRYDRAEADSDEATRTAVGPALIKLGAELSNAGWAMRRGEKRRKR